VTTSDAAPRIGLFLPSEEHGPRALVEQARLAERAGFDLLAISDHFHPWTREQGQSPFVWSVLGALSEATGLPLMTAVTCPMVRTHPAVVAQAAATVAVQTDGRFVLGVGTGEALNEHVLGDPWPRADVRLEMLEEAVEVMRLLWSGETVHHRGRHYRVDDATLFTLPDRPPEVHVSAYAPKSAELAGRIGDGLVTTFPEADLVRRFRGAGGTGPASWATKICWGPDEDEAVRTAKRLWAATALPGELAAILPSPRHFEQAAPLVTEEMITEAFSCGPDTAKHVTHLRKGVDAGLDTILVSQIGPAGEDFFAWAEHELLPALRGGTPSAG
jgi:G6PDH family F420-dependent oxidoreductase